MSWIATLFFDAKAWLAGHLALGGWLVAGSLLVSVGGLWAVRWLVLSIPSDYFNAPPRGGWRDRHPLIRWTLVVGKNAIGAILLLLGITMLLTPGPGIVTLLVAVILLDVPGKRALERRIITLPSVLHWINRLRSRANRPMIEAPIKT